MTNREKLQETHERIQQSYGLGEMLFESFLPYQLEVIHKIMAIYIAEFPDHTYHVNKEHQQPIEKAIKDCSELIAKNIVNGFVQNKFLNCVKADETTGFWLFIKFVDEHRNGFLEKPFQE